VKINTESKLLTKTIESASEAVTKSIESIGGLDDSQKKEILETIRQTDVPAVEVPDTFVYRLAVGSMAIVSVIIVVGGLIIAGMGENAIPEFLKLTLATAIGALAGMVVPSQRG